MTTNADLPISCVKCETETKYLIPTLNHELRLLPVCWRCFERADKRVNLKPGWNRRGRNNLNGSQFFGRNEKQNAVRGRLRAAVKTVKSDVPLAGAPAQDKARGRSRAKGVTQFV